MQYNFAGLLNWYLLLGIIFSYISTYHLSILKKKWHYRIAFLSTIVYSFFYGFDFQNIILFLLFCFFWGGFFYSLAIKTEETFAKLILWKNENLFNIFSQRGLIFFLRKVEEGSGYEKGSAITYIMFGEGELNKKNYEKAIEHFNKATDLSPNFGRGYACRAITKIEIKDLEGALLDWNRAIELSPNDPFHYIGRSSVYQELNKKELAMSDRKRAFSLNEKSGYDLLKNFII